MLVNRVGDFGLALWMFCIFVCFGAIYYTTVFTLAPQFSSLSWSFLGFEVHLFTSIGVLLFICAVLYRFRHVFYPNANPDCNNCTSPTQMKNSSTKLVRCDTWTMTFHSARELEHDPTRIIGVLATIPSPGTHFRLVISRSIFLFVGCFSCRRAAKLYIHASDFWSIVLIWDVHITLV